MDAVDSSSPGAAQMPPPACAFGWTLVVLAHSALTALLLVALGGDRPAAVVLGIIDFAALEALMVWTKFGEDSLRQKLLRVRPTGVLAAPLTDC